MEKIEFYELVKREIPYAGIMTAAIWSCALCRNAISGMGGPGSGELCLSCGRDIMAGHFKVEPRSHAALEAAGQKERGNG